LPLSQAKAAKEEIERARLDRKRARRTEVNAPKLAAAMADVSKAMSQQAAAREEVKGAMAAGLEALKKKKKKKHKPGGGVARALPM